MKKKFDVIEKCARKVSYLYCSEQSVDLLGDYVDVSEFLSVKDISKICGSLSNFGEYKKMYLTDIKQDDKRLVEYQLSEELCDNQLHIERGVFTKKSLDAICKRKDVSFDKSFIDKIEYLKSKIKEYEISREEIVVVNGAALEAYGIRKSGDVDIIVSEKTRRALNLGSEGQILTDLIEIKPSNLYRIRDDVIIFDERYHVFIHGLKFMDPRLVLMSRKIRSYRKQRVRQDAYKIVKYLLTTRGD